MKAVVYRPVMEDVEIEVTPEEAAAGVAHMPCPSCGGDGVFSAHPDADPPCVRCSSRGEVAVSV